MKETKRKYSAKRSLTAASEYYLKIAEMELDELAISLMTNALGDGFNSVKVTQREVHYVQEDLAHDVEFTSGVLIVEVHAEITEEHEALPLR